MRTIEVSLKSLLLSVSAVAFLSGCSLPKPASREQQDNNASFFIDSAPGEVRPDTQVNSLGLPEAKTFSFSACVKDSAKLKPITNQNFKVQELGQTFKTDMNGCLTWSEKVSFNYLADSQYVQLDRHLLGTGLHTGVRTVSYGINPWAHGESIPQIVDLTKASVLSLVKSDKSEAALKGLNADGSSRRRSLWAEEGALTVTQQKFTAKGVDLLVEFRAKPALQLTKMNGDIVYQNLSRGQFKARFTLINTFFQNGQEKRRVLGQSQSIEAQFTAGSLLLRAPVSVESLPTSGTIAFGLELSAVHAPAGLTSFEGVYQVGEFDKLKAGGSLKLDTQAVSPSTETKSSPATAPTLKEYVNQNASAVAPDSARAKLEIGELSFSFLKVLRETSSNKEVLFSIKACPKSSLDQKMTRDQKFQITHFGGEGRTEEITSDNNGCLIWNETITFNYFECQHYYPGEIRVQNADLALDEKIEILINPWEKTFFFGKDGRYVRDRSALALSCEKEKKLGTKLWLKNWGYNSTSYDYKLDSTLDLTLVKKVHLTLDARLVAYTSNTDGIDSETKLRAGLYLLKVLVTGNADYQDGASYVTHVKKVVTVTDGQVNTDLDLVIRDLKTLGNRNNIIFTLIPMDAKKAAAMAPDADPETAIDTASGLDISPFIGPVLLNADDQSKPLRALDAAAMPQYFSPKASLSSVPLQAMDQIIATGVQKIEADRKVKESMANKESFARDNNLQLVNLNQMDKAMASKLNPVDLQTALISGTLSRKLAHRLCVYWATDFWRQLSAEKGVAFTSDSINRIGQSCAGLVSDRTSDAFTTEKRVFVKDLGGFRYVRGSQEVVSVGTNFSVTSANSKSVSTSYGWSATGGLQSEFLNIFGLGVSANYGVSWSDTDSTGSDNSQHVAQSTNLTVQQSRFELSLNKYEQCGIVRLNPNLFKDRGSWLNRGLNWAALLDAKLSTADRTQIATRGFLVCSGVDQQGPLKLSEDYYFFNQDTFYTHIQDSGDARNRNFVIAVRGQKEFQRFLTAIKGTQSSAQGAGTDTSLREEQVSTSIHLFQLGLPTYPGTLMLR